MKSQTPSLHLKYLHLDRAGFESKRFVIPSLDRQETIHEHYRELHPFDFGEPSGNPLHQPITKLSESMPSKISVGLLPIQLSWVYGDAFTIELEPCAVFR
jgi:hypothetical protein